MQQETFTAVLYNLDGRILHRVFRQTRAELAVLMASWATTIAHGDRIEIVAE